MTKLWPFISRRLAAGQPVMLLAVVESSGSSPGRAGFKMAVDAAGGLCGSIGGGIMEIKLVELARRRLEAGETGPLLKRQIHRKSAPHDQSGMICSGEQTVVLLRLDRPDLTAVRRLMRCLRDAQPGRLYLRSAEPFFQAEAGRNIEPPQQLEIHPGDVFEYRENIGHVNRLYIIGGGHCALALSEVMARLDFHIQLFDDRPELSTLRKNRFVHRKQVIDGYDRLAGIIPSGPDVYVVVMTIGYRTDEQVIRSLLDKEFKYFGVLGSAAKMATLLTALERDGLPPEKLRRIHTPIGLNIHSRTPEEIAVSVAAEIIAVKNGVGENKPGHR